MERAWGTTQNLGTLTTLPFKNIFSALPSGSAKTRDTTFFTVSRLKGGKNVPHSRGAVE